MCVRMRRSSLISGAMFLAYQRDSQSRMTPTRNPTGWTFFPTPRLVRHEAQQGLGPGQGLAPDLPRPPPHLGRRDADVFGDRLRLHEPSCSPSGGRPLLQRRRALGVGAVTAEGAGGGELAQLVADHLLADVDGHVLTAVVDGDGVPDELRQNGRAPRPGADHAALPRAVQLAHLHQQVRIHERALLSRPSHLYQSPQSATLSGPPPPPPPSPGRTLSRLRYLRRFTIRRSLGLRWRVFAPRVGLPHGLIGPGMPIGERPSPPPCG